MTRAIAFASALAVLPLIFFAYDPFTRNVSVVQGVLHDPRGLLFSLAAGVFLFVASHGVWLACRAFNFAMRKLT